MASSQTTPQTPESPSSPQFSEPNIPAPVGLRVRQPARPKFPPPVPPTPSATTEEQPPPSLRDPVDDTPSSGVSVSPAKAIKGKGLKKPLRGLIKAGSLYAHRQLATSQRAVEEEAWIATDEEQRDIADPLASIVERRGIKVSDNPDIEDAFAAAIAFAGYLIRNITAALWTAYLNHRDNTPRHTPEAPEPERPLSS